MTSAASGTIDNGPERLWIQGGTVPDRRRHNGQRQAGEKQIRAERRDDRLDSHERREDPVERAGKAARPQALPGSTIQGDEIPRPAIRAWTMIALTKPISGPTETSMPPRPPRIAGVAAIEAAISGAARPIVAPHAAGAKRAGSEQDIDHEQHDQKASAKPVSPPRRRANQ